MHSSLWVLAVCRYEFNPITGKRQRIYNRQEVVNSEVPQKAKISHLTFSNPLKIKNARTLDEVAHLKPISPAAATDDMISPGGRRTSRRTRTPRTIISMASDSETVQLSDDSDNHRNSDKEYSYVTMQRITTMRHIIDY